MKNLRGLGGVLAARPLPVPSIMSLIPVPKSKIRGMVERARLCLWFYQGGRALPEAPQNTSSCFSLARTESLMRRVADGLVQPPPTTPVWNALLYDGG